MIFWKFLFEGEFKYELYKNKKKVLTYIERKHYGALCSFLQLANGLKSFATPFYYIQDLIHKNLT